jgi:hypothetical protein
MDDQELDLLLRGALAARPEAVPGIDLAAEALHRVRALQDGLARIERMRWWGRTLTVAAGLLIVATVAVGWWAMPTLTTSSTETAASADTTTTESADMGSLGLGALAVAVVGVAGAGAMGTTGGRV